MVDPTGEGGWGASAPLPLGEILDSLLLALSILHIFSLLSWSNKVASDTHWKLFRLTQVTHRLVYKPNGKLKNQHASLYPCSTKTSTKTSTTRKATSGGTHAPQYPTRTTLTTVTEECIRHQVLFNMKGEGLSGQSPTDAMKGCTNINIAHTNLHIWRTNDSAHSHGGG